MSAQNKFEVKAGDQFVDGNGLIREWDGQDMYRIYSSGKVPSRFDAQDAVRLVGAGTWQLIRPVPPREIGGEVVRYVSDTMCRGNFFEVNGDVVRYFRAADDSWEPSKFNQERLEELVKKDGWTRTVIRPAAEQAREAWVPKVGDKVAVTIKGITWRGTIVSDGCGTGNEYRIKLFNDNYVYAKFQDMRRADDWPVEESPVVPMTTGGMTQADLDQVLGRNEPETLRLMRPVEREQYEARQRQKVAAELKASLRAQELAAMAKMENYFAEQLPSESNAAYRAMCEGGAE